MTEWGRNILAAIEERDARIARQARMIAGLRDELDAAQLELSRTQAALSLAQAQLSQAQAALLAKDVGITALQRHIAALAQMEHAA